MPVPNSNEDRSLFHINQKGEAWKRGGRRNVPGPNLLDRIIFDRISMLTDPALDAGRHEFYLNTILGRILPPEEFLRRKPDGDWIPPTREIFPFIIGSMSFGALSPNMWLGLLQGVAYCNEVLGIPVVMCTGEGGCPPWVLKSPFLKYIILQIASGYFGWDEIIRAIPEMQCDPAAIEIKYGQGAKPGDGGLLMWFKVSKLIARLRGVPEGVDLPSPPVHQTLYSIEESVMKMIQTMSMAFGFRVPVYPKISGSTSAKSVLNNLVRNPYAAGLLIDGIDGGTGAAYNISMDATGHPIASNVRECYLDLVAQGKQNEIPHLCRRRYRQKRQRHPERHGPDHAGRLRRAHRQIHHAGRRRLPGQREEPLQRLQRRHLPQGYHQPEPETVPPARSRRGGPAGGGRVHVHQHRDEEDHGAAGTLPEPAHRHVRCPGH